MESGGGGVVGDFDLGACLDECFERPLLGTRGVDRGDDPHPAAPLGVTTDGGEQCADPGPADERHDDVDAIRRVDLGLDLGSDSGFPSGVGEQDRVTQRCERPTDVERTLPGGIERLDGEQPFDRFGEYGRWRLLVVRECSADGSDEFDGSLLSSSVGCPGKVVAHPLADEFGDAIGELRPLDLGHVSHESPSAQLIERRPLGVEQDAIVEPFVQFRTHAGGRLPSSPLPDPAVMRLRAYFSAEHRLRSPADHVGGSSARSSSRRDRPAARESSGRYSPSSSCRASGAKA